MQRIIRVLPSVTPLLFAVFPILYLFQYNQTDLPPSVLWAPLTISAAIGIALLVISWIFIKQADKAALLASLLVVAIFYFGIFYDIANTWGINSTLALGFWLLLLTLGGVALYRAKSLNSISLITLVASAYLVLVSIANIGLYRIQNPPISTLEPRLWSSPLDVPQITADKQLPDIYYIAPDDYGRTDVLKEYMGYDNSAFIQQLKNRGFVIAEQGRSPYSDSESNMASALNLDYLSQFANVLGAESENALIITQVLEDNRASHFLNTLGYQYIHIDSDNTTYPAGNLGISPIATPDNLTYLWLRASILRAFGGKFGFDDASSDERFRQSVLNAFERLNHTPEIAGPKFIFFHTLIPHDPFVFGSQGESVTFPNSSDERLGSPEAIPYYIGQLEFSNQLLLESIDEILANSNTPPVIILQADEGFQWSPETFGEEAMLDIRLKGLTAIYIPGKDVSDLPQNLNTVNTFRYLFDLCFGTHLGMLENASYGEGEFLFQRLELHVIGDPESP